MNEDLMSIKNQLIPLENEGGLVAKIDATIARHVTYDKERVKGKDDDFLSSAFGNATRVSDLYISRYGVMGYVEYSISGELIAGILEMPKRLALMVQAVLGDDKYKDFCKEFFGWYLNYHEENISLPQLQGIKFLDDKYFWAAKPDFYGVGSVMNDQIGEISSDVISSLKNLDSALDAIFGKTAPQKPSEQFQNLRLLGK